MARAFEPNYCYNMVSHFYVKANSVVKMREENSLLFNKIEKGSLSQVETPLVWKIIEVRDIILHLDDKLDEDHGKFTYIHTYIYT